MSKLNQIQQELKQINQAKFQEVCDSYLYKEGYTKIEPFGSMIGKEKTVKGTPDSFIRLPNGKFIFVEYTTDTTNLFSKLEKDLDSCFDEDKTGIHPSKIDEIIVCHNSKLAPEEEEKLAERCAKYGCSFKQIGIGALSLALLQEYPGIAKDFLGIEIDTRQILTSQEFIDEYQKSAFATRLDIVFHFREEELKTVTSALERQELVIVAGRAGVGKSRLALESCRQFIERYPSFRTYCIYNKTLPLYDDLKTYFSPAGDYLILIDDANHLSQLEHVFRLIKEKREDHQIKIIATVRDYALEKVKEKAHDYLNKEIITLAPLKNEQIKELISSEYGINNHLFLDRIKEIAKGNPRLAVMAAEIIEKEKRFDSIADATDLYEEYFNRIDNALNGTGNEVLLKAAGIISFFGALDRSQNERFSQIAENFGIDENELWGAVNKLHTFEFVDIYENEVARISDQILATYLFYKIFLRDELLDFSVLLENYSESYKFNESVFPVVNTFNSDSVHAFLQKHVDRRWKEIEDDEPKLLQLADKFWFLKQTDTLLYLKEKIDALPESDYEVSQLNFDISKNNITDEYLKVLENFQHARMEDFKIALELIFSYVQKRPDVLPQALYLLLEKFCFHFRSYDYGYIVQKTVVDILSERSASGLNPNFYRKISLKVAEKYLKTYFHSTWMEDKRRFSYVTFGLVPCPQIFEIRANILQFLVAEYIKGEYSDFVLQIIAGYSNNIYEKNLEENTNDIAAEDAKTLLPFLASELNPEIFAHCNVAQKYFHFLEKQKVSFNKMLKTRFVNETYCISKVLTPDRFELYGLRGNERDKYKRRVIRKFFADYTFEDYAHFFESCHDIALHQERHNAYQFESAVGLVLKNLFETDIELFKQVFEHILAIGNKLNHVYRLAIQDILSVSSNSRQIYELLQKYDYRLKAKWVFAFLTLLSEGEVNEFYLNELYNLYRTANLREAFIHFDDLVVYRKIDGKLIPNVIRILFERMKKSGEWIRLDLLFNPYTDTAKELKELFKDDWDLLKEVYLHEVIVDKHTDYRGEGLRKILEVDPKFINEFLEHLYGSQEYPSLYDEGTRYSALWELDEYEAVITDALEFIYRNQRTYSEGYANVFFRYEAEGSPSEKDSLIYQKMEKLIADYIEKYYVDSDRIRFIFDIIVHSFSHKRRDFLEMFLQYNKNYDDFEKIRIEPGSWSAMGSVIPVFEEKIEFLESLKPLFSSSDFLKHKIHINNEILTWKRMIERESKSEFIDED